MRSRLFPITDDHIHFDPVNGRGVEAAKDFLHAGGTHIFLVSKPSWSFGIAPACGADYAKVFDETLRVAGLITGDRSCRIPNPRGAPCRDHPAR